MKKQSRILALFAALFLAIVPLAGMAQSSVNGLELSLTRSAYDQVLENNQLLVEVRNKLGECNTLEQIKAVQKTYEVDKGYGAGFIAAVCNHPSWDSKGPMEMGFVRAKNDYYQRLISAADLDAQMALRALLTPEEFNHFAASLNDEQRAEINKPLHQSVLNALASCTTVQEIKAVEAEYDAQYGSGFTAGAVGSANPLDEAVAQAFHTAAQSYFVQLVQAQSLEDHETAKALLSETEYAQFTEMLTQQEQSALTLAADVIAARVCTCSFGGTMDGAHESECGMRQYFSSMAEGSVEEIAAFWLVLTPAEQEHVLSYVDDMDAQKGIQLRLLVGVYNQVETTVQGGGALSIMGELPEGVTAAARLVELELTEYGQPVFAIDVELYHNGEKYTLPEGKKLTVTVDVQALGLENGQKLNLYHIVSDDKTEYLQMSAVTDGKVIFQTSGFSIVYATEAGQAAVWSDDEYVYLDLYYGNITISTNGFTMTAGTTQIASGSLEAGQSYYIYQSASAAAAGTTPSVPEYDRVDGWADYIYGNTDVDAVSSEWARRAADAGRTPTQNRIDLTGTGNYVLTIDNIWSQYEKYGTGGTIRGGINNNNTGGSVTLKFKNDSRVSAIHKNSANKKMIFAGESDSTITAVSHDGLTNWWNAAIGNNDSSQTTYGLEFHSGHVYAGTRNVENCTAIGAGGNGYAQVTIKGGTVTAVAATSGTAIGGGIGYHSPGGNADITISGGKVYAYNGGYKGAAGPIPAAAIGGGSSYNSDGNTSTIINITGGEVYAEAVHGVAIGGGGSGTKNGGKATVTISGDAKVTARSVAGTVHGKHQESGHGVIKNHGSVSVEAGASIGGGTGSKAGGDSVLTIKDNATVITGSIGGGKATSANGTIGSATVAISGNPTIQGQVVMSAGSATECKFTMTGGTIDNSNRDEARFIFIEQNGGALYAENGKATMSGTAKITGCSAVDGGAIYVTASGSNASGVFEMVAGTIEGNSASGNGGAVCVEGGEAYIKGGQFTGNTARNGGAVSVTGGQFDMTSGELTGNYASAAGGAVYINGGTSSFTGGTLSGNGIRTADGSSVYTPAGGAVYVENTGVAFGTEDGDSAISVTGNYAQNGAGFYLKQNNNQIIDIYNGTISQNIATSNGGGIYQEGAAVCNVNGGVLTENEAANGAGLYISDSIVNVDGGEISQNTASQSGGGVFATGESASCTVTGGVVEWNTASNGAGLYINGSTVNVDGGEISCNTASTNGGGVYATGETSNCTVTGGDVKQNAATTGNGGGFYVNGGELSMQDGTVSLNTAAMGNGGGAYVNNATVIFGGEGEISVLENSAKNGGGFYVDGENADVTVSGGTISQNTASQSGGGMYVAGGTFSVDGGTISENAAQALHGGGVVVDGSANTAKAELTGGAIAKNTAAENGGGVYTTGANARCVITDGVIGSAVQADEDDPDASGASDKNTAKNGAGLFVGGGTLVFSGGTIGWNEASMNGGGLAVAAADGAQAVATIQDGYIGYNTAQNCGGGIYMNGTGAEATISNNITITENEAANGGGVHLRGGSELEASGGFIMKNRALGQQLSGQTAYEKDSLAGVGGGVSVASGTGSKATRFTLASGNVGLYDNRAGNAADDVFASGQNTQLTLPSTDDLQLSGEYSSADGWYEDYVIRDSGYEEGWGGDQSGYVQNIVRYRTEGDVQAWDADIDDINTPDKYVCLTLGVRRDGVSDLTIVKEIVGDVLAAEEQPMFVFYVIGTRADGKGTVEFTVPLKGAGSVTVDKVPNGEYTVTEDMQWAWRYECVSPASGSLSVTLDENTVNTGATVTFQNKMKTENPWIEGSISKDNKYEINTNTGGGSK